MNKRLFVILTLSVGLLLQPPLAAGELSEDELRMKEQLTALSRGEGSVADLRIKGMDGNMASFTRFEIAGGKVGRQGFRKLRSPTEERAVTDEEVRKLLRELVEKQYWTFQGTRFIPDADGFLFQFYYKDLKYVAYSCDAQEYQQSEQRSAIRSILLDFVSDSSPAETPVTR